MIRINLAIPFVGTADEHVLLAAAGIRLYPEPPKTGPAKLDFSSVQVELRPSAIETLSQASAETLNKLFGSIDDPEVRRTVRQAENLLQLRDRSAKPVDGFYVRGSGVERPFTWGMEGTCRAEIGLLAAKLKKLGISSTQVGIEVEFALDDEPIPGFSRAEEVKDEVLRELGAQLRLLPHDKRLALEEKMAAIAAFNAREMLMYDMIECDPRTRDHLERIFGVQSMGTGYYDAANVLELKIKPTDAIDVAEVHAGILDVLYEKAKDYGLCFVSDPSHHVNLSFWTKDGNLFLPDHPDYHATTKRLTEGLARGFYDFFPVAAGEEAMGGKLRLREIGVDYSRESLLQLASNRLEVRIAAREGHQHISMTVAVAMAAALDGLDGGRVFDKEAALVANPSVRFSEARDKMLAHMISNSTVRDDGALVVPIDYVRSNIFAIGYALGLQDYPPGQFVEMLPPPPYVAPLKTFLDGIRIVEKGEGFDIVWPANRVDGKLDFAIPGVNWDKIPRDFQERILKGMSHEELNDEALKHIGWGGALPQPPKTVCIDTERLRRSIVCVAVEEKYITPQGYDPHDLGTVPGATWLSARRDRCLQGEALRRQTSPAFQKGFGDCVDRAFPAPTEENPRAFVAPASLKIRSP